MGVDKLLQLIRGEGAGVGGQDFTLPSQNGGMGKNTLFIAETGQKPHWIPLDQQQRILNCQSVSVFCHRLLFIYSDTDYFELAVLVPLPRLLNERNLLTTRCTPRRPKIDQQNLAPPFPKMPDRSG